MSSSVEKTQAPHVTGNRCKSSRPMVVPAIPLPLVKKQQQKQKDHALQCKEGGNDARHPAGSESFTATSTSHISLSLASEETLETMAFSASDAKVSQSTSTSPHAMPPANPDTVHHGPPSVFRQPFSQNDDPHGAPGLAYQVGASNGNLPTTSEVQQPAPRPDRLINGGITFGSFRDSTNTSPSPNQFHTGIPPLGLGNPPLPYGPYNPPRPGLGDWPSPPRMALSGDLNGYTPAQSLNSPTPASFRGSQSPDNLSGGSGAHGSHDPGSGPFPVSEALPFHPSPSPYGFSSHIGSTIGHTNGTMHARDRSHSVGIEYVHFLQQQRQHTFYDPRSSDCYLVLHFPQIQMSVAGGSDNNNVKTNATASNRTTSRGASSLFMGHRAVLAQSYTLSQLLLNSGTMQTGTFGYPVLVIHVNLDDPYVTMDETIQTLRSLYGISINDVAAGTTRSRVQAMDAALASLASGFLFMSDYVEMASSEQACRLLDWDTVEKVLAFCLNGVYLPNTPTVDVDMFGLPYPRAVFRYARGPGQALRQLLQRALDFIVWNFPADFVIWQTNMPIDPSPIFVLRFPPVWSPRNSMAEMDSAIAKNTATEQQNSRHAVHTSSGSVSLPSRMLPDSRLKCNPQPSKIVFGDFSPSLGDESSPESLSTAANDGHKQNDGETKNSEGVSLSRILLGLPFGFVNYVIQHPDLGRGGSDHLQPLPTDVRRIFARHIAAERERHRLQVLAEVRLNLQEDILARICGPSPPIHRDYPIDGWDILGWKEVYHEETGVLVRSWAASESEK